MRLIDGFEVVHIAEEHMVVPVGEQSEHHHGVTVLNEAAAFLIEEMKQDKTIDDLVQILLSKYDVDKDKATTDVKEMVDSLISLGIISI